MALTTSRFRLSRPSGLRAGVGIGLALALVGALVGTATGAITPFQQVVVVNAPTNPIPVTGTVTGTVNVGNFPATQSVSGTVNVGNFPATQSVSGTVDLGTTDSGHLANIDTAAGKLSFDGSGNLKTASTPAAPALATKFWTDFVLAQGNGSTTTNLGQTINATSIVLNAVVGPDDLNGVFFELNGERRLALFGNGAGDVVVPLPLAIPINQVTILCSNNPCEAWVSIAGF